MKCPLLVFFGAMLFLSGCDSDPDRELAFQAKVKQGTPIVRAIEKFHQDTGAYPATLEELVPKYLSTIPKNIGDHPSDHWEYFTITNFTAVTYDLSYFMGKGGVSYSPPNWTGDNDGHRRVLCPGPQ